MDVFPSLKLSPCKLRLNYTLTSKSTKSTKSKKQDFSTVETPTEQDTRRFSLSPKKSKTQCGVNELCRLEDELDSDEISLKLYEIREFNDSRKREAESGIYEKYINGLIQCVSQSDSRLGKSLSRGWKGFLKSINKTVSEVSIKPTKEVKVKSISIQVTEDLFPINDESDIDKYINHLHSAMKGINKIQVENIIKKLNDLSYNLKPVDIPSPSSSPEVEELDFTDTMKVIHTKLKASIRPKRIIEQQPAKKKLGLSKHTQTFMRLEDFKNFEGMKVLIKEKEVVIAELNNRLREKVDIEENFIGKIKECEELKKNILEIQSKVCPQCKLKKQQIDESQAEIKAMQLTVHKAFSIEKELETAKTKLKETINVVTYKTAKIIELQENVDDLIKKVEETRAQKELMLLQLAKEEKLRETAEIQLKKEIEINTKLMSVIKHDSPGKLSPNHEIFMKKDMKKGNQDFLASYEEEKKRSISPITKNFGNEKMTVSTPSEYMNEKTPSRSPSKYSRVLKEKSQRNLGESNKHMSITIKKNKQITIMRALNMTKEEYLALSKNARIEIFEALYEHKERCGADCEHLKRAMLLRYKYKGELFPTKKYNIS